MSLTDDAVALRAAIHAAHDQLHYGRVDQAHEALHCALGGEVPATGNISPDDAANIQSFTVGFNALALRHQVMACTIIMVPSVTDPRRVSLQMGGNVAAIQQVRHMMGMKPTIAQGDRR